MGETIELSGGTTAYRAAPATGEGSGVLVLHAWWGLNEMIRGVCDQLAESGFVALAPDMFGGVVVDTPGAAEEAAGRAEQTDLRPIVRAGLDRLRGEPGVAADGLGVLGFSFGAAYALLTAAEDPTIAGCVVCYGTAGTVDWSRAEAAFQGHFAETDPFEPLENVDALEAALREAGRRVEIHRYPGASHWFLEPNRPEYDVGAADLAWGRIHAFLRERLP